VYYVLYILSIWKTYDCYTSNVSSVNGIQDGWLGLSIVISLGNWWIIKGGIYVSKEKWKNYDFWSMNEM